MDEISIYSTIVQKAKSQGISINTLEEKAMVSKGSICKWRTVSPTAKSLKKVADILECTIDELVNGAKV